ncbi:MAG TPA: tRNA (cytidine(56)-2'-O)-methyltransferase [Conexivisphaerales archaeon]|nr:tRNA (cytidine(56)-2'-O)-methyltransferase [Conexivisphaerales archaeon]
MPRLFVFRLSHRPSRDKRITTHCALVARAFGAESMVFSGEPDDDLISRIGKVAESWGGDFSVTYEPRWESYIRKWKERGGVVVHCTMYGERIQDRMTAVRKAALKHDLLVVVGGEKVPGTMYRLADFNIAVTSQPHSEVAALAIFLDRLLEGRELELTHEGARLRIVPQKTGKKLLVGG